MNTSIIMNDINNEQDIALLVDRFYKKVIVNHEIGHFFTRVVKLSWEHHLPVMVSFWCTTLLGAGTYRGNPMTKHMELDSLSKLEKKHFDEWLHLWEETISESFIGPKASEAIARGKSIAAVMLYKVEQNRS